MNKILRIGSIIILLTTVVLAARCQYLFMKKPHKIEKIEVIQTEVDCIDLAMPEVEWIIFVGNNDKDLMRFNLETGDIYWKDRLIITDKELVEGLRNIIQENRCLECKKIK